jgi:hypothetical protein
MTTAMRTLEGDPFAVADRILGLRSDVADAAIEWALAERELAAAGPAFDSLQDDLRDLRKRIAEDAPEIDGKATDLSRAAAIFLDATKREHDAMVRWKSAARALTEALERNAIP